MFPGAHSEIYRNEAGEVLGWSNTYYDEEERGLDPYEDEDLNWWPDEEEDVDE